MDRFTCITDPDVSPMFAKSAGVGVIVGVLVTVGGGVWVAVAVGGGVSDGVAVIIHGVWVGSGVSVSCACAIIGNPRATITTTTKTNSLISGL